MMDIIGKKAVKISDEIKIDDIGQRYRETKWNYKGHDVNVNIDLDDYDEPIRYHGKVDNNDRTVRANMDEGGLITWFFGLFGR